MSESSTQEATVVTTITPEVVAFFAAEAARSNSDFIFDMHMKLSQGADLTERQEAAILKTFNRSQERAAQQAQREVKLANAPALTAGKQVIVGRVVSSKYKESQFGTQAKMLLELADGNRVWGTVPSALLVDGYNLPEPGTVLAVEGKVEVSDNDPHFGFITRPRPAKVIDPAGHYAELVEAQES